MKQCSFFFITDEFFTRHNPDGHLMKNKEGDHNRPCFYAFPDNREPAIYWCIPISSRIEKYERIVANKIAKQIEKGHKTPKCNTIRFGKVLGQKRAFLIQNMFPVTSKYISGIYIDKNTQSPVTIPPATEKDIVKNAKDILKLVLRGYDSLVFSDIRKIYAELATELRPEWSREHSRAAGDILM